MSHFLTGVDPAAPVLWPYRAPAEWRWCQRVLQLDFQRLQLLAQVPQARSSFRGARSDLDRPFGRARLQLRTCLRAPALAPPRPPILQTHSPKPPS
ncbi:hypothetical protein AAFF_G00182550 [Aldrovandia affinis]|uniref:Uncharacterized protein n=1 Tax=Aldrovandia affinis TaxID=143900 RepID=A0AAD7R077_9TELE|nr:hypothetical protein AAFF_G00182550 [Aldrovandia affinis]